MLYLHPNPQETLSPLLSSQLPYSISPLGAIIFQSNLFPQPHPFPVWASFPPSSSPKDHEPWLVLVAQVPPSKLQLRLYCSLERVPESERTEEQIATSEELVLSSVREVKETSELWKGKNEQVIVGAVNKMWLTCLGWKGTDLYGIWLAREGEKKEEREEEVHEGGPAGGVVGVRFGEEEDVDEIIKTSKILRPKPYIQSLLPFSSIASLPSPTNTTTSVPTPETPIAWILTHSDCSLGTLYTQPSHRRKGLARRVVQHRLANGNGVVGGFCFVETGNLASEGLWRTMGWELGWETGWVYFG